MSYKEAHPENRRSFLRNQGLLFYVLMGTLLFLLMYTLSQIPTKQNPSGETLSPEESAWTVCAGYVEQSQNISADRLQEFNSAQAKKISEGSYLISLQFKDSSKNLSCLAATNNNINWQVISVFDN